MKRFTFRDPEGTIRWIPELLEDDTGLSGELIRGRMCELEDLLDGCSLDRLRALVEADRDGRCVMFQRGYPTVSEYSPADENGLYTRTVTGVVTRDEYEVALKARKQDG